jgi:hypothetical protein
VKQFQAFSGAEELRYDQLKIAPPLSVEMKKV